MERITDVSQLERPIVGEFDDDISEQDGRELNFERGDEVEEIFQVWQDPGTNHLHTPRPITPDLGETDLEYWAALEDSLPVFPLPRNQSHLHSSKDDAHYFVEDDEKGVRDTRAVHEAQAMPDTLRRLRAQDDHLPPLELINADPIPIPMLVTDEILGPNLPGWEQFAGAPLLRDGTVNMDWPQQDFGPDLPGTDLTTTSNDYFDQHWRNTDAIIAFERVLQEANIRQRIRVDSRLHGGMTVNYHNVDYHVVPLSAAVLGELNAMDDDALVDALCLRYGYDDPLN
jgi:hypothetical protein